MIRKISTGPITVDAVSLDLQFAPVVTMRIQRAAGRIMPSAKVIFNADRRHKDISNLRDAMNKK